MKIAIISDWFTEGMGYAENMLPKALSGLGHDVYLITSNGKTYFTSEMYETVYAPVFGPGVVDCYSIKNNGFYVQRLPHSLKYGHIWIEGLYQALKDIAPDVVQVFEVTPLTTLYAAWWSRKLKYKLFSESRMHASVFFSHPDESTISGEPTIPDRIRNHLARLKKIKRKSLDYGIALSVSKLFERSRYFLTEKPKHKFLANHVIKKTEKCYPLSQDVYNILIEHFNWPREKLSICPLGVDTDLFHPCDSQKLDDERTRIRNELGFQKGDIVCMYSGRFTPDKSPLTLALAIDQLVKQGLPFRGLFIGSGDKEYAKKIEQCSGCVINPFMEVNMLPPFYRASDVAVWPKQESTSQLDAMACGLPLILSDKVMAAERIAKNALTYREGDSESLADALRLMISLPARRRMGNIGSDRVKREFSWCVIASRRIEDYQEALERN